MTYRGLYIADGPSDLPLSHHLQRLCADAGADVEVVPVGMDAMPRVGRAVSDRLAAILQEDDRFELIFVHRDAESAHPATRHDEVRRAVEIVGFDGPAVAVVPVRMTEAWLLLDPDAICRVAGRPSAATSLALPKVSEVEGLRDPKAKLREALIAASGARSGRRLQKVKQRFYAQRRTLLEELDPCGRICELHSWQSLHADIVELVSDLTVSD